MQTEKQMERLVELLDKAFIECDDNYGRPCTEQVAEYIMSNNVVVLPCVAYNKSQERYQVIHNGKDGRIFASRLYYTRKDAENVLKERKENGK